MATWNGFWTGVDLVIAVSVSWIPLAADYSRHSRSPSDRVRRIVHRLFGHADRLLRAGAARVQHGRRGDPSQEGMFGALIAVPVGWLAFGVLVLRELDESFANVYSTAISAQNLAAAGRSAAARDRYRCGRDGAGAGHRHRVVPELPVPDRLDLRADVRGVRGAVLRLSRLDAAGTPRNDAPSRYRACSSRGSLGFVAYQLVNPGSIAWWAAQWHRVDSWLHFTPPTWLSASLFSFVVAFAVALLFKPRRAHRRRASRMRRTARSWRWRRDPGSRDPERPHDRRLRPERWRRHPGRPEDVLRARAATACPSSPG